MSVTCGHIRDGGCRQYRAQRLKSFPSGGAKKYDEAACRVECKKFAGCAEFFIGKKGGDAEGGCYLYKSGSQSVCTSNSGDENRYAMYMLNECESK